MSEEGLDIYKNALVRVEAESGDQFKNVCDTYYLKEQYSGYPRQFKGSIDSYKNRELVCYLPEINKLLETDVLVFIESDWCLTKHNNLYKLGTELTELAFYDKFPELTKKTGCYDMLSEDTLEKYNETLVRVKSGNQFKRTFPTYYVSPNDYRLSTRNR